MSAWSRLLNHVRIGKRTARQAFPEATLKAIQATIAAGENLHRAEVRVIVEPALHLRALLNDISARQRARDLFRDYSIWDTEENCGILLYINLADRKIEIIADRGINKLIHPGDWHLLCGTVAKGFARGVFHDSLISGLEQLNELLKKRLPSHGEPANELSNRPLII